MSAPRSEGLFTGKVSISTPRTYAQGGLQGVTLFSHAVPPTPLGVPACARPLGMPRGLCYGQL